MKSYIAWIIGAAIVILWQPLHAAEATIKSFSAPASSGTAGRSKDIDLREGKFHGLGKIDRITPAEVVISDRLYKLTATVAYRHDNGALASSDDFKVGTTVWFVLDSDNRIKELWIKGG